MAENSTIEWTHHTFNPWIGCTKVSVGPQGACVNCYAEKLARRLGVRFGSGEPRRFASERYWDAPFRWNAKAEREGVRRRVFCASMADVFDNEVPQVERDWLWELIEETPSLDWLLLTKRIGNAGSMLPARWIAHPRVNVWLGATIATQEEAERDIPKLINTAAAVRFLSCEPLLGPIDLNRPGPWSTWLQPCSYYCDHGDEGFGHRPERSRIDWVICGGESGHQARPMHPDWAMSLRDQCVSAGVRFFFKQWGEYVPMLGHSTGVPVTGSKFTFPDGTVMGRAGKKAAGRLLEGMTWSEFPR